LAISPGMSIFKSKNNHQNHQGMRLILFITCMFPVIITNSQTLNELEYKMINSGTNQLPIRKALGDKIFAIDKYNETAVKYLIDAYRYKAELMQHEKPSKKKKPVNYNDTIRLFFDHLVSEDPGNPIPYLLKAKVFYKRWVFLDTVVISAVDSVLKYDPNNVEANYLRGRIYYAGFNR
jgi:hypothetical protein